MSATSVRVCAVVQYFATQPDPTLCHSTKATDHNQDITSKNDQNKDTCHFLVELGLDVSRQRNERFLDVDTGLGTRLKELDIVLGSKLHVTNTQTQSYNDIGQHHMSTVTHCGLWSKRTTCLTFAVTLSNRDLHCV